LIDAVAEVALGFILGAVRHLVVEWTKAAFAIPFGLWRLVACQMPEYFCQWM
jgi:hypothetical protein